MTEILSQTTMEDAVSAADGFLQRERGTSLDGAYASEQVAQRVMTVAERAEDLLTGVRHPRLPSLYVPLSKHNVVQYDEAIQVLPGHMVLVPSPLVGSSEKGFYPAVVSEDSITTRALRLHVLHQPYHLRGLGAGAATLLSAAGQSETIGVGEHGRVAGDGVEAEHFATLLTAGSDASVANAWRAGRHVNHEWRERPDNSVSTQLAQLLLGQDARQSTVTVTREQITHGRAVILWHESLRDDTGKPEAATRQGALVTLQALGHQALTPAGVDDVKRLLT